VEGTISVLIGAADLEVVVIAVVIVLVLIGAVEVAAEVLELFAPLLLVLVPQLSQLAGTIKA